MHVSLSTVAATELLHAIVGCVQVTCSNAFITYRNWYVRKYSYSIRREVTLVHVAVEVVTGTLLHTKPLKTKLKLNSVALVRERTIPTERPPPVGEVSANFRG